jgi:hypothetical protein
VISAVFLYLHFVLVFMAKRKWSKKLLVKCC